MARNFSSNDHTDVYQLVTNKIIELLENGVIPWHRTWDMHEQGGPKSLISGKQYQGINYFLLGCQSYASPYWLTFKQALDKGGHVRKGEKGSPCIFWKVYNKEDADAVDGFRTIPVLRYYTVFNAEQCEGIELPKPKKPVVRDNKPIEMAEKAYNSIPDRPLVVHGTDKSFYMPTMDRIFMPDLCMFKNSEAFYATLFHELAHSTGHKKRLNREGVTNITSFGSLTYGKEELVAEMASAYICNYCGIGNQTITNSAAYIQGWLKAIRQDKRMLITAAAAAQKATDYILNIKRESGNA